MIVFKEATSHHFYELQISADDLVPVPREVRNGETLWVCPGVDLQGQGPSE